MEIEKRNVVRGTLGMNEDNGERELVEVQGENCQRSIEIEAARTKEWHERMAAGFSP